MASLKLMSASRCSVSTEAIRVLRVDALPSRCRLSDVLMPCALWIPAACMLFAQADLPRE